MNRRGQIFLLLTILSITFITAISSVLLDIQRSQYIEPSADADKIFEVWDNTIYSIEQTISVQISINTQAAVGDGNFATEIQTQLDLLETYLNSRGFIASINVMGQVNYTAPIGGLVAQANMSALIFLQITSSSGTKINQIINFNISYKASAVPVGVEWLLTMTKTVNNQTTFLTEITYLSAGTGILTDNFNGSYQLDISDVYTITTSENIELIVTT